MDLKKKSGMTVSALARKMETSRSWLSKVLSGCEPASVGYRLRIQKETRGLVTSRMVERQRLEWLEAHHDKP